MGSSTRSRRSSTATASGCWSNGCRTTAPTYGSPTSASRPDSLEAELPEHGGHAPRGAATMRDGVLLRAPVLAEGPATRPLARGLEQRVIAEAAVSTRV